MRVRGRASAAFLIFFLPIFLFPLVNFADHCGEEFVCHEGLVKFSRSASSDDIAKAFAKVGATPLRYFEMTRLYHVQFNSNRDTLTQIQNLRNESKVLISSPNSRVTIDSLPNDPYFSYLWGLRNTGQFSDSGDTGVDIGIENVWTHFTDSSSIVVAVIDTGVDYTHPDLADNMWVNTKEIAGNSKDDDGNGYVDDIYGYDFYNYDGDPYDDHYHGTHVAGTIGAVGNNGIGVVGVSQKAKIMAVKFLSYGGWGYYDDAVAGIEYAVANGAKVLNNSWGGSSGYTSLQTAISTSDSAGVIFVAAAGNSGQNADYYPLYPAAYSTANIISVAATTYYDDLAYFSNYGAISVDLGAPGYYTYSTLPTDYYSGSNDYAYLSGTSMATPHVSGAAALLWAAYPTLTHRQVINLLLQGVTAKSYLSGKSVSGGMLNLATSIILGDPSLNHAPVANAGSTLYKEVGDVVTLQGSATDQDGDTSFTYSWSLTRPTGSSATLSSSSSQNPYFTPDIEGTYYATLQVSDWVSTSVASTVDIRVTKDESPPNVVIRAQKSSQGSSSEDLSQGSVVELGQEVVLDAGSSTDDSVGVSPSSSSSLGYEWTFIEKPSGSGSALSSSSAALTSFRPDAKGTYTVRLTVDDGHNENSGELSIVAIQTSTGSGDSGSGATGGGVGGCQLQVYSPLASGNLIHFFGLFVFLLYHKLRKIRGE